VTVRLSIFDVDRTITRRPTYSLFLLQAMVRTAPHRLILLPALLPLLLLYAAKKLSRRTMKQAMHWIALGPRLPRKMAHRLANDFAEQLLANGLLADAKALMQQEAAEGRTLGLATAAPDLYIQPLAQRLGIDIVVASQSIWKGDTLSHQMNGENCYGAEKLERLKIALEDRGLDRAACHIRFFTDDASDAPTCLWANEAVAVNPSRKMVRLAQKMGWPIIVMRRD
jgi:HAD superfamily phosphoserine phosphatase-like hydrolase